MWLTLTQGKQLTAQTVEPQGMYFTPQQILSVLSCLFFPPLSLERSWQTLEDPFLRNVARKL